MKFDEIDEFDEIIITFTDQNDTLLEIEDKFNLILLILNQKWHQQYSTETRIVKYGKEYEFLSFAKYI